MLRAGSARPPLEQRLVEQRLVEQRLVEQWLVVEQRLVEQRLVERVSADCSTQQSSPAICSAL